MKSIIKILVVILIINLTQSCKKEADNTIRDIDGNVYTSVTIGTQVWLVENLKTTKYSNGDLIGTTTPASLDISTEASPKYQWAPDRNESNIATFGRLYTGYVATDTRNVCPTGWHLPTDEEWMIMVNYLGGGSIAGGKLKEAGTTHWSNPNEADNSSGFTALPSGGRTSSFFGFGSYGNYWCSATVGSTDGVGIGLIWEMSYDGTWTIHESNPLDSGWSIRCLRDN